MTSSVFDRLLHPALLGTDDPEEVRRARTTAAFAGLSWCMSLLMVPTMFVIGDTMAGATTAVATLFAAVPIWLLRRRGKLDLAIHLMLLNTVVSLTPSVVSQGGLGGSAVDWFALMPLLAAFLLSRGAWIWLVVTLVVIATFGVLDLSGVLPHAGANQRDVLRLLVSQLSVAACTFVLARAFERNKVAMAQALQAAHAEAERARATAQGVLDTTDQGLFTISHDGRVGRGISAAAVRWFGAPTPGVTAWTWLVGADPTFAAWLELGCEAHREAVLPAELTLAQLPQRLVYRDRAYAVRWLATGEQGELLAVVTDVTEVVEAERAERSQREVVALLARTIRDRQGVLEFLDEADAIVRELAENRALPTAADARRIHTLKGNAGLFGLVTFAAECHEVESRMAEHCDRLDDADRETLQASWLELRSRIDPLLGRDASGTVAIPREEIDIVVDAIRTGRTHAELETMIRRWGYEPMAARLARIAEQARGLAARLDRGAIEVHTDDNGVALCAAAWGPFWSAFAHVVRNAIDHGLESPEQRVAAGKPVRGQVWLTTSLGEELVIAIRDDGRGIDWDAVRRRAAVCGLPCATRSDLERALFADGFTTKEVVTAISGRGVGMAVIADVTARIGGYITVRSNVGQGTTFEFRFPERAAFCNDVMLQRAA